MADHARKQIRDAVVTLVTGLTTTGANVYSNRKHNFAEADLPCLNVIALPEGEDGELSTMGAGTNSREMILRVECRAQEASSPDDTLDDKLDLIAAEVEAIVDGSTPVVGVLNCSYMRTDYEDDDAPGKPIGKLNVDFRIEYNTAVGAPTVIV